MRYAIVLLPSKDGLPKRVGSDLPNKFGVSSSYPRKLRARVKEQPDDGRRTLSLKSRPRFSNSFDFGPRKMVKIRHASGDDRTLSLYQLSAKLDEVRLIAGSSKLQPWFEAMVLTKAHWHIRPSLSFSQSFQSLIIRTESISSSINHPPISGLKYVHGYYTVRVNKTRFHFNVEKKICVLPEGERVGATKVHHKPTFLKLCLSALYPGWMLPAIQR